jgi:hypothetical protein
MRRVPVFFYGSFIRPEVLEKAGVTSRSLDIAELQNYDIFVGAHADIYAAPGHSVYGVLAQVTHEELDRLYSADGIGLFLPEAVIVDADSVKIPALCYIPPERQRGAANPEYLTKLIEAAERHGFPAAYIARLRSLFLLSPH